MSVRALLAGVAVALGLAAAFPTAPSPRKKLLQWGWDEPDTAFLRAHLREMEQSPFDGCVFSVRHGRGGARGSFTWEFWGRRRFAREDVADAFADLRALRPRRFQRDSSSASTSRRATSTGSTTSRRSSRTRGSRPSSRAPAARAASCSTSSSTRASSSSSDASHAAAYGWEAYAAQARLRGREVMTAFQEGYPDLTVFLTFGYSLPWVLSDHGRKPLAETPYGLLAPFLDGLLEAASGRTRVSSTATSCPTASASRSSSPTRAGSSRQDVLPIVGAPEALPAPPAARLRPLARLRLAAPGLELGRPGRRTTSLRPPSRRP